VTEAQVDTLAVIVACAVEALVRDGAATYDELETGIAKAIRSWRAADAAVDEAQNMTDYTIRIVCKGLHEQVIQYRAPVRKMAEDFAGLLDGTSRFFAVDPRAEPIDTTLPQQIGRCSICRQLFRATVEAEGEARPGTPVELVTPGQVAGTRGNAEALAPGEAALELDVETARTGIARMAGGDPAGE
jgi:hypothetical protein